MARRNSENSGCAPANLVLAGLAISGTIAAASIVYEEGKDIIPEVAAVIKRIKWPEPFPEIRGDRIPADWVINNPTGSGGIEAGETGILVDADAEFGLDATWPNGASIGIKNLGVGLAFGVRPNIELQSNTDPTVGELSFGNNEQNWVGINLKTDGFIDANPDDLEIGFQDTYIGIRLGGARGK